MTDQEAKDLLIEYLYGEMNDEQKKDFEKQLQENPALKKEFQALQSTRKLLQFVPLETPPHKLVMMAPEPDICDAAKRSSNKNFLTRFPGLTKILATAASLLIILLGAAFVDLRIGQTEQGFSLSFGEQPEQVKTGMDESEVKHLIEQVRNENTLLMNSVIEHIQTRQNTRLQEIQAQQNARFEEALNTLATYYERRRRQDLQLISDGFLQLEKETNHRFMQTDEALEDLMYTMYRSGQ